MDIAGVRHASASLTPAKIRYPLYRRLGGLEGWPGRVRKIPPSTRNRSPDLPTRSQSLYRRINLAHVSTRYFRL